MRIQRGQAIFNALDSDAYENICNRASSTSILSERDGTSWISLHPLPDPGRRFVLVNAALVEEIHPSSTGDYVLRVRGGREFTATRTYKKNLGLLAQLWIGIENFAAG